MDDEYGTQTGRNVAVFATDTDWFAVWDGTDGERATVAEYYQRCFNEELPSGVLLRKAG